MPATPEIVLVLDNIRSLYNVGSMFRTADGFGVRKIWLCGITGTPHQNGLKKVALGAEDAVPWEHAPRTWRVLDRLKKEGYRIVGLETLPGAVPIASFRASKKTVLVVGNEVDGLSSTVVKRLDAAVSIPMRGVKRSYNVAVACGIALFSLSSG